MKTEKSDKEKEKKSPTNQFSLPLSVRELCCCCSAFSFGHFLLKRQLFPWRVEFVLYGKSVTCVANARAYPFDATMCAADFTALAKALAQFIQF